MKEKLASTIWEPQTYFHMAHDVGFNRAMTFFIPEHTDDPAKVLDEMLWAVRPGGIPIVSCPNFGPPLFRSLEWERVTPFGVSEQDWRPDYDTTVEPYAQTAMSYLSNRNCSIRYQSSMWQALDLHAPAHRILRPFAALAQLGMNPFTHWGTQLSLIAEKQY